MYKIKNEKIECLECGKYFKRVCTHVRQSHGLTAREYKELHGLDVKRGILTYTAREHMREKTTTNKTIDNLKSGAGHRFVSGHSQNYKRSEQTMERLKEHWGKVANKAGRSATVEKVPTKCAVCGNGLEVYPRYYQTGNNYCGVKCRNIANNRKRYAST